MAAKAEKRLKDFSYSVTYKLLSGGQPITTTGVVRKPSWKEAHDWVVQTRFKGRDIITMYVAPLRKAHLRIVPKTVPDVRSPTYTMPKETQALPVPFKEEQVTKEKAAVKEDNTPTPYFIPVNVGIGTIKMFPFSNEEKEK